MIQIRDFTVPELDKFRELCNFTPQERMIGKLETMMDDAPSEKERKALQQCVDKLQRQ